MWRLSSSKVGVGRVGDSSRQGCAELEATHNGASARRNRTWASGHDPASVENRCKVQACAFLFFNFQ